MCGRYARYQPTDAIMDALRAELIDLDASLFHERPESYNVMPTQEVVVVARSKPENPHIPTWMRWGFVPFYARELGKLQPINAKCETVATSGMFRQSFNKRRCLIPASGFYEWDKGTKPPTPHFFRVRDRQLFCFGGIYDVAKIGGEQLITVAIITTPPNAVTEPIHDRMPLILHASDYSRWCDPGIPGVGVEELLRPYPAEDMTVHRVSRDVSMRVDGPSCIVPVNSL